MRFLMAALSFLSLIFLTPHSSPAPPRPATFESCSCTADDGSCNVSGECPRGCLAYCPSGRCRFTCVGAAYEDNLDTLALITLRLKGANSKTVATELSRLTGAPVTFKPRQLGATFSINVTDEPIWNVLDTLSSEGEIQIANEDFAHLKGVRQAFLGGERMSVCFYNVTAKRLATDLSFLTGQDIYVAAGDPRTPVYYKGSGVRFEEILAEVSQTAGVQLAVR